MRFCPTYPGCVVNVGSQVELTVVSVCGCATNQLGEYTAATKQR